MTLLGRILKRLVPARDWVEQRMTPCRWIRPQLAFLLYALRIIRTVEQTYERRYRRFERSRRSRARESAQVAPPPKIYPFLYLYERLTTIVLCLTLIKNLFIAQIANVFALVFDRDGDGLIAGYKPECLIPGRFVMIPVIRKHFETCFILFILTHRFFSNNYAFSLFDFLIQRDAAIESFYEQYYTQVAENHGKGPIVSGDHPFTLFMCYEVLERGRLVYKLRPNRTAKMRANLKRSHVWTFILAAILYVNWALIILVLVVLFGVTDMGFLYGYPGCDPELEHAYEHDPSHRWFWYKASPYRYLVTVSDLIENLVVHTSFGACITLMFAFPFVLNLDLIFYQSRLHDQAVNIYKRLRSERVKVRPKQAAGEKKSFEQLSLDEAMSRARNKAELRDLCWLLRDFFGQIIEVDCLMSNLLSIGILFWILSVLVISNALIRHYLVHPEFLLESIGVSLSALVYIGLPLGFIPISGACLVLFYIHTMSLKTYHVLQSLLAYSREAPDEAMSLCREVTESFVRLQRNCYTVFHSYPFKATSYMSMVGWTISSLAILAGLLYKD